MRIPCYLIAGLPGSGKTTLAYEIAENYSNPFVLDDMSLNPYGSADFSYYYNDCIIITDPFLCGISEQIMREKTCGAFVGCYKDFELDFHIIYFENDLEACLANAARAPKPGGTANFSKHLSRVYTIPPNADVRKVWKPVDNG